MPRCSLTARRSRRAPRRAVARAAAGRFGSLAFVLTFLVSLLVASGAAQAVVVNDSGTTAGVALVPGSRGNLGPAGVSITTSSPPCTDPFLSSDLGGPFLPSSALCFNSGSVMHKNETFDLGWDPLRRDWATTRNYVEQFLRDVADGSGTRTSPYAVTGQYKDGGGRAGNVSAYGGGCIDFGNTGGSCQFGNTTGSGPGHSYPTTGNCPVNGTNQWAEQPGGAFGPAANDTCLTDAQIQSELATMITQSGMLGRTEPGYTPLVVLMTPPGVTVCLDSTGHLCSANANSTAQFCSYHSQVNVGGTEVAYVVQPWVASWTTQLGCDDPSVQPIPNPVPVDQLAKDAGIRLVSPLSQAHLAAITNPALTGWYAPDGSEINDNYGCQPWPNNLDQVTVGNSGQNPYFLQREFNNAGVIESDPNALACTPNVLMEPAFVVPSAVNQGDLVEFDGSKTVSSLIVPGAGYAWNFGDGKTATGPSVTHTYAAAGTYLVTLTATDRGGNVRTLSQTIQVLGPTGQSIPGPSGLRVRLQLMPQSRRSVLSSGVTVRVSSNQAANAIATVSISRREARRAHIKVARGPSVVIGRGTVSSIRNGTVTLHLRLSQTTAAKLRHLRHVTLTVRLALVSSSGGRLAVDAAGRY